MELQEALSQLSEIRARIESAETFRGYRSMTVAFTGCLAVLGGIAQPLCVPDPRARVAAYLTLWIGIAIISMGATAAEMVLRCVRIRSESQSRLTRLAAAQFLPSVLVGALVTATLFIHAPDVLWLLPGLWSLFFSLGVFASARLLPRAVFWVAGWYLLAGLFCLAFSQGTAAFSPWSMGVTFGGGQMLAAAILYFTLERNR